MTPARLFDGDRLRAEIFNENAGHLFVSFRHRLLEPGAFSPSLPVRSFVGAGYAHLHIQSRENDWYVNDETEALAEVLADIAPIYGRRVSMGFSMGGYGALRFSQALMLRRVILVAPQVSIHPDVVPWDTRFHHAAAEFDPERSDLGTHGRSSLHGVILIDPFRRPDLLNALSIQALFPNLRICRLGGGTHVASRVLREGGRFGAMQRSLLARQSPHGPITEWHRQSRRESPSYWAELADIARRHDRRSLAAEAQSRADALRTAETGLDGQAADA